jgi:hypothetical protein
MAIQQVVFEIPTNIMERLLTGEYNRFGGIVRDSAGHIIEHLKEVPIPEKIRQSGISSVTKVLKNPKVIIVLGLGVVVAGGIAYVMKARDKKQSTVLEMQKCIENYNASFCAYLEAVRRGSLDVNIINSLISDLDDIKENNDGGKINIDFSTEQLEILANLVFDYTRKLAEANSVELDELKEPMSISADTTILDLRHYLQVQKQIFERVA